MCDTDSVLRVEAGKIITKRLIEFTMQTQPYLSIAGSILILFLTYVLISTGWKSYKDDMGWRWVIVLILALASYIGIGVKSGAFVYMWEHIVAFVNSPPWRTEEGEESTSYVPGHHTPKLFSAQQQAPGLDLCQHNLSNYPEQTTLSL